MQVYVNQHVVRKQKSNTPENLPSNSEYTEFALLYIFASDRIRNVVIVILATIAVTVKFFHACQSGQ